MKPARVNVPGVTVDDRRTHDMDDAIWVEPLDDGYKILVSIADAARAVPPGSELNDMALERLGTQYFWTGNSPMLPWALSERKLSLWPHKPKKTVTVQLTLTAELALTDIQVYRSTLTSKAKLAYDQLPSLVNDTSNPLQPMLALARKIAEGLLVKRRAAGAMVLYDLNHGWVACEEGHVRQLLSVEDTFGYIIVQEMMILANMGLAIWAEAQGIPILFRNHEGKRETINREELMAQIEEAAHTPLATLEFLRQKTHLLLERAQYGGTPKGHFGLNLTRYCHFTSPIRRYPDLVTHQQVRAFLRGDPLPYTGEQLEELGVSLTQRIEETFQRRAEAAKNKANARADKNIEARRLDGLLPKEFERVTKVQVRSGEAPHPHFVEAFLKRVGANLPSICLTVVLIQAPLTEAWLPLRKAILEHLQRHPEEAVTVVTMAQQIASWPPISFTTDVVGVTHTSTAMLPGDEPVVSPAYAGLTRKETRQYATVGLLHVKYGFAPPQYKAPKAAVVAPPKPLVTAGKHPVSILGEWSQRQKISPPEYTFTQEGPPHAPQFVCTARVGGLERQGKAGAKGDAKVLAATALIGALTQAGELA